MLIKLLTSLFTGGIGKVADTYRDIKIAKVKESTQLNNVVKELELERLANEKAAHQAAKEVRIATKDHWEIRVIVFLIAFPIALRSAFSELDAIYKFGWEIPPLSDWQLGIVLSFFGLSVAKTGINAVTTFLLRK